jgi:hypothetical protein
MGSASGLPLLVNSRNKNVFYTKAARRFCKTGRNKGAFGAVP